MDDDLTTPHDDAAAAPEQGAAPSSRRGRHAVARKHRPFWQELAFLMIFAVVVAVITKAFLVQLFYIPSGSMENTLLIGDRVAVNKVVYRFSDIKRGDVIVFNGEDSFTPETTVEEPSNVLDRALRAVGGALGVGPTSERDFVKRVIGVGGDNVVCCDDTGRVTVNGVPLDEPYLFPGNKPSGQTFNVIVPEGKLFVMGDHRSASSDSRSRLGDPGGGMVPEGRVIGKAFAVVWPFSSLGWISRPDTYDQDGLSAAGTVQPDALGAGGTVAAIAVLLAVPLPFLSAHRRRLREPRPFEEQPGE
jgi:signal peptidase I